MNKYEVFDVVEAMGDKENSEKMSAYMQNLFPFRGIPKPELKKATRPYLKLMKKKPYDWEFMKACWEKDYREAQYIGIMYICEHDEELTSDDIDGIKYLVTHKSWWETVDQIDAIVGHIIERAPEEQTSSLKKLMLEWSVDENIWLRRIAIDFQQEFYEHTDTDLLEKIIVNNLNSEEFFINKAIGWSLRDYSHTNPEWVSAFIAKHEKNMATLSIKEAKKYL